MKPASRFAWACLVASLFPLVTQGADDWRGVTTPTVAEAAASFDKPPMERRGIHWAIWGGQQSKDRIIADIDRIAANGGGVYMINNSQRVTPKYLSPEYMDLVKAAVQECKAKGMKVWIETDCGYPDGFAGGLISSDYPQLGMQGIFVDARCTVAAGATLDIPLPADTLGIYAVARPAAAPAADPAPPAGTPAEIPADGIFKYTAARRAPAEITVQLPGADIRYTATPGQPFKIPVPREAKAILVATSGGAAAPAGGRGAGAPAGGQGAGTAPAGGRAGGAGGAAGAGAAGGRGAGGGGGGRGAAGVQGATVIPVPADGCLKWTAPAGTGAWEISFVRHNYKSSPTRNDNGEDGGATKDSFYTLIDYLDPQATATFIKLIHEAYAKAVGDEFGKTVMGFRGDETDYTGVTPWTPKLLETFKATKGYDLQPYIVQFLVNPNSQEALRAKADYWDVWSAMFRDNFYKPQQDWCNARGMEYMTHLNHEELMTRVGGEDLIKNEGSFWRDMRYAGVPGVDNLSQIAPGTVADFPKLAGSAAHLFGRALVWTEEGGGLGGGGGRGAAQPAPTSWTGSSGKFVFDYQLVRGINYMNIRGLNNAAPADGSASAASQMGWYAARAQYLMSIGRPAAQVALYHPTDSMWLGDHDADVAQMALVTKLLEHQVDFDHIDQDSLATVCTLEKDGLKNLSGQVYRAVIVPPSSVIQKSVLDRLKAFAAGGGKVVFIGRTPTMVVDKTFLNPLPGTPDLSFATLEPSGDLTPSVLASLPQPDVALDSPAPAIKYLHRSLKDGELYLLFNESSEKVARTVTLAGTGKAQTWDAQAGKIQPIADAAAAQNATRLPLTLEGQETRFIVIAR